MSNEVGISDNDDGQSCPERLRTDLVRLPDIQPTNQGDVGSPWTWLLIAVIERSMMQALFPVARRRAPRHPHEQYSYLRR